MCFGSASELEHYSIEHIIAALLIGDLIVYK